jgi:peptide/nickel transport system ATP-binding protein/oligopeptide transport system ATP-binding protein
MPMLAARDLTKTFEGRDGSRVLAVDGVDLDIEAGTTLALIGESGSGKSTLGRLITRLLPADRGTVTLGGTDLTALSARALRRKRGEFQVVFQEPYASLNPRMTVGEIVAEPLVVAGGLSKAERRARVLDTLHEVGLPAEHAARRPGDLSGGQQQRVGIARALVTDPRLVVLDEPTSSLDLSVRAGILRLLARLQQSRGLTYLFISHDIHTVQRLSDRTAVMYLGRIVEVGPTQELLRRPQHPYTKALLSAALSVVPGTFLPHFPLKGDPPKPTTRYLGCPLVGRCPIAIPECAERPIPLSVTTRDHKVACLRPGFDLHVVDGQSRALGLGEAADAVAGAGGAEA